MSDLAAFLKARLDEEEAAAKAAIHLAFRQWHVEPWYSGEFLPDGRTECSDVWGNTGFQVTGNGALMTVTADHIARHDPARVLREVEAGRALLADYNKALSALSAYENDDSEWAGTPDEWAETGVRLRHVADVLHRQVKLRAAVWYDHPDYQQNWSPGQ